MEVILTSRYQSPAGELMVASIGERLCMCDWITSRRNGENIRRLCYRLNARCKEGRNDITEMISRQLDDYFAGIRRDFLLPVLFVGTQFQCRVWNELVNIRYGEVVTYRDVANGIGNGQAVRAVATAIAMNPLSIIVPCHRVIGSDGRLAGYAGGLDAKSLLLNLERNLLRP